MDNHGQHQSLGGREHSLPDKDKARPQKPTCTWQHILLSTGTHPITVCNGNSTRDTLIHAVTLPMWGKYPMLKSRTLYVKICDAGTQAVKYLNKHPRPGVAYPPAKRHCPLLHDETRWSLAGSRVPSSK
jgi:hypothetical protein